MTDTFTASNGFRIDEWDKAARLEVRNTGHVLAHELGKYTVDALREFFQAERDNELGRWRWPENPDWVVFPPADHQGAFALNESTGERGDLARWEVELLKPHTEPMMHAIAAYFDAHPEPKPWHDAKPGEIWVLTYNDEPNVPAVASSSENGQVIFTAATNDAGGTEEIGTHDVYITAGRRLFPEATE